MSDLRGCNNIVWLLPLVLSFTLWLEFAGFFWMKLRLAGTVTLYSICVNCLEPGTSLLAGCSPPDALELNVNFHTGFICVCMHVCVEWKDFFKTGESVVKSAPSQGSCAKRRPSELWACHAWPTRHSPAPAKQTLSRSDNAYFVVAATPEHTARLLQSLAYL